MRLLESEIQAAFAAPTGGIDKMRGQARLAGAGGAGNQDGAAPVVTLAAEHGVQTCNASGYPFGRGGVIKAEG